MKKNIFEYGIQGRCGYTLPQTAIDEYNIDSIDEKLLRKSKLVMPALNEHDISRYYRNLLSFDDGSVPSLNGEKFIIPIIEDMSRLDGFTGVHPYQLGDAEQGVLELMYTIEHMLDDMLGMDNVSFQAVSRMQGLLSLFALIKAYLKERKSDRREIITSKYICKDTVDFIEKLGFTVKKVNIDLKSIKQLYSENTFGVFIECDNYDFISNIKDVSEYVHDQNGVMIADVSNIRSIIGVARPGDMGFDCIMFDLEKIFGISYSENTETSWAVAVKEDFVQFMPVPFIDIDDLEQYYFNYNRPLSIGKVNEFYGNISALIKSLGYILSLSFDGLKRVSEINMLNKAYADKINPDIVLDPSESAGKELIDEYAVK